MRRVRIAITLIALSLTHTYTHTCISQAPSKKILAAAVAAVVPATVLAVCPVDSFDGYDFSNVMSTCGDLRSSGGCDSCYTGLLTPVISLMDYVEIDEAFCADPSSAVSDLLADCQDPFSSAVQNQVGFRAAGLLGLRNCDDFASYEQVASTVDAYFNERGIDVEAICGGPLF